MLTWDILLFGFPIALAIVLGAGALSGLLGDLDVDAIDVDVDMDVDADVDADGEADTEGESGDWVMGILSLLGVGRAPLTVLLSAGLLTFGATGLLLRSVIHPLFALAVALVIAPVTMGSVGRVFGRYMPTSETYATTADQLVGCTGVARLPVGESFGVAQITDDLGSLHQIQCRVESDESLDGLAGLAKGEALVVVDYDPASHTYTVAPLPALARG